MIPAIFHLDQAESMLLEALANLFAARGAARAECAGASNSKSRAIGSSGARSTGRLKRHDRFPPGRRDESHAHARHGGRHHRQRHGITRQRVHQLLGPRPRTVRAPPKPAPTPPTRKAFAAALLAWRRRHGLSQAGAARLLGVTTHSVSSWEQQRWAAPWPPQYCTDEEIP